MSRTKRIDKEKQCPECFRLVGTTSSGGMNIHRFLPVGGNVTVPCPWGRKDG